MKYSRLGGWPCNTVCSLLLIVQLFIFSSFAFADAQVGAALSSVEKGEFAAAIHQWQAELATLKPVEKIPVMIQMAQAYLQLGQVQEAYDQLLKAKTISSQRGRVRDSIQVLGMLSDIRLLTRNIDQAMELAEKSVALAKKMHHQRVLPNALNQLGNVQMAKKRYQEAFDTYDQAIQLSERLDDKELASKLRINAVHALLAHDLVNPAIEYLNHALTASLAREDSYNKALDLIAIGYLFQQIIDSQNRYFAHLQEPAYRAYSAALIIAKASRNKRLQTYAYGHLGELYLSAGKLADAEVLLRQGIFAATENLMPELSARWYRLLGKLKRKRNLNREAIALYKHAVADLESVESALIFGYRGQPSSFRDTIGGFYLELVELLLQQSDQALDNIAQQHMLEEVKQVMEQFKTFELKNYFQDDCVTELQSKLTTTEADKVLDSYTAIIYPVILPDRIITLISFNDGRTQRYTTTVSAEKLTHTALTFREQLLRPGNPRRLRNLGLRLYEWLFKPLEKTLSDNGIDTLVIVPDDILRAIPYAALFDGNDFLIAKYALAVTPGLSLTNRAKTVKTNRAVLLSGLSEPVQEFTALPFVSQEIAKIAEVYQNHQLLLNQDFKKNTIKQQLSARPYTAAVFSTHAHLAADPQQSFLLTYDSKINLDELEQYISYTGFHDQPLDLLVLSACETASGDDRALLGLAGMAVKSGANSVLASLWPVNDTSTAELIPAFFQFLNQQNINKAKALQLAQKKLLATLPYRHPYYWAGFVMVGEWQ